MKASQVETLQVSVVVATVAAVALLKFKAAPAALIGLASVVILAALDSSRPAYKIRALPAPPVHVDTTVEWEDDPPPDGPVSGYFSAAGEWISGAGDYVEGIEDWIYDNPF